MSLFAFQSLIDIKTNENYKKQLEKCKDQYTVIELITPRIYRKYKIGVRKMIKYS